MIIILMMMMHRGDSNWKGFTEYIYVVHPLSIFGALDLDCAVGYHAIKTARNIDCVFSEYDGRVRFIWDTFLVCICICITHSFSTLYSRNAIRRNSFSVIHPYPSGQLLINTTNVPSYLLPSLNTVILILLHTSFSSSSSSLWPSMR